MHFYFNFLKREKLNVKKKHMFILRLTMQFFTCTTKVQCNNNVVCILKGPFLWLWFIYWHKNHNILKFSYLICKRNNPILVLKKSKCYFLQFTIRLSQWARKKLKCKKNYTNCSSYPHTHVHRKKFNIFVL